ncbi:MAG: hypothetical protein GXP25_18155 [Planctomycetes bacterium]|nr:hypothetical protein [Planctomycetota bacterium]
MSDADLNADPAEGTSSPITLRAILVGVLLTSLLCVMCPASLMAVKGSYLACDFTLVAAHFLFFAFILLVNSLLTAVGPGWAFRPGELLTVYLMLAIGCNVTTMGLVAYLLPTPAGLPYYASPENKWAESICPYVPTWLMPADEETIRYFFEGLPTGASIPWSQWIVPLLWWGVFLLGLYSVMFALTVVFRRQWIDREHLVYPLAQLPMEMMQQSPGRRLGPFFRNGYMWVGFAIPFLIYGWNCLGQLLTETSGYHLPRIVLYRGFGLMRRTWWLRLRVSFTVIGLVYLINLPISFSIWFFSLVQQFEDAIFKMIGLHIGTGYSPYSTGGPILASQGIGAMLTFIGISVWLTRGHLWEVFRCAVRNEGPPGGGDEAMSPRTAVLVLIGGSVLMGAWLVRSGLPWVYAPLLVVVILTIFLAITRIVVESGVPLTRSPMIGSVFLINIFGSNAFGTAGVAALGMTCVWAGDVRTFAMCTSAHAWKLSDSLRIRKRPLLWVMAFAVVLSILVSSWATLKFAYTLGGCNANRWFFVLGPQYPWRYVARLLRQPQDPSWGRMGFMAIGAAAVVVLTVLHHRFTWWPLHPIGIPVAMAGPTEWFWFSIFLGWLVKRIIMWVGGAQAFQRTKPLFLGMVLGNFASQGFWFVISWLTGIQDIRVPI